MICADAEMREAVGGPARAPRGLLDLPRVPLAEPGSQSWAGSRENSFEVPGGRVPVLLEDGSLRERAVEVPLGRLFLERFCRSAALATGLCMELGATLPYNVEPYPAGIAIHDLYDAHSAVTSREDLSVPLEPGRFRGKRVVSISTVEHLGWDTEKSVGRRAAGWRLLRQICEEAESFLVTFGLGWNPFLDELLGDSDRGDTEPPCPFFVVKRVWKQYWEVDHSRRTRYLYGCQLWQNFPLHLNGTVQMLEEQLRAPGSENFWWAAESRDFGGNRIDLPKFEAYYFRQLKATFAKNWTAVPTCPTFRWFGRTIYDEGQIEANFPGANAVAVITNWPELVGDARGGRAKALQSKASGIVPTRPFPPRGREVLCHFTIDNAVDGVHYNGLDMTSIVTGDLARWQVAKSILLTPIPGAYLVISGHGSDVGYSPCSSAGFAISCDNGISSQEEWQAVGSPSVVHRQGGGSGWQVPCTSSSGFMFEGSLQGVRKLWAKDDKRVAFRIALSDALVACRIAFDGAVTSVYYDKQDVTALVSGDLANLRELKEIAVKVIPGATLVITGNCRDPACLSCSGGGFALSCDNGATTDDPLQVMSVSESISDTRREGSGDGWVQPCAVSTSSSVSREGASLAPRRVWARDSTHVALRLILAHLPPIISNISAPSKSGDSAGVLEPPWDHNGTVVAWKDREYIIDSIPERLRAGVFVQVGIHASAVRPVTFAIQRPCDLYLLLDGRPEWADDLHHVVPSGFSATTETASHGSNPYPIFVKRFLTTNSASMSFPAAQWRGGADSFVQYALLALDVAS